MSDPEILVEDLPAGIAEDRLVAAQAALVLALQEVGIARRLSGMERHAAATRAEAATYTADRALNKALTQTWRVP